MSTSFPSAELHASIDEIVYDAMRTANVQEFINILWINEPFPSTATTYRQAMGYVEDEIEKCQPEAWAVNDGKPGSLRIVPEPPLHPLQLMVRWAELGALTFAVNEPVVAIATIKGLAETSCQSLDGGLMLAGVKLCFALGAFSVKAWLIQNLEVSKVLEGISLESIKIICNPEKSDYARSFSLEARIRAMNFLNLLLFFSQYGQGEQMLQGQYILGRSILDVAKGIDLQTRTRFKMNEWAREILRPRMDVKVRNSLKI